jgi:hypothetical protein
VLSLLGKLPSIIECFLLWREETPRSGVHEYNHVTHILGFSNLVFRLGVDIPFSRLRFRYRIGAPARPKHGHHFRRKRTLVLTSAASGSSLGSIIHPIMLNYLLSGPIGFANGVRVRAGLVSVLLLIACELA